MITSKSISEEQAFLAGYRLPPLSFFSKGPFPVRLKTVWVALNTDNPSSALSHAAEELREPNDLKEEEKAALYLAVAAAELQKGAYDAAKRWANRSLNLYPEQWSGHRILLSVLSKKQAYQEAYFHLMNHETTKSPVWDEPPTIIDHQLALASWSWLMGEWDMVAEHLMAAYPKGLTSMPSHLQEDWFRLSLYRNLPEEVAAAASHLILDRSVESTDELLQIIVQSGWTSQALPLYRTAFAKASDSPLLRRRLVALCIKEGDLEEARRLAAPGALSLAA